MKNSPNRLVRVIRQAAAAGAALGCLGLSLALNAVADNCAPPPDGMVANWRGEGNASDSFGANNGSLRNGVTFAPGMVGQGFSFDGTSGYVLVPNSAALNLTNELTIEFWYKDTGSSAAGHGLVAKRTYNIGYVNYGIALDLGPANVLEPYICDPNVGFEFSPFAPPPTAGVFHHLAAAFRQFPDSGSGPQVEIRTYVDGLLLNTSEVTGNLANTLTNTPVIIGASDSAEQFFKGIIDEVAIYKRALTPPEIEAIYLAGSAGKCTGPTPPYLYVAPANTAALAGTTATLMAAVGGSAPIRYQWALNGTNVPGATNYSLTFTNVQTANGGAYSVSISNAAGSMVTPPVELLVPTVDQSQTQFNHWDSLVGESELAQTFTPGVSGQLADFQVSGGFTAPNPAIVTIMDTVDGQPGTNVLGSTVLAGGEDPAEAFFTNTPVYLNAGTLYAAVFTSGGPETPYGYNFRISWGDSYVPGGMWRLTPPAGTWQVETDPFTTSAIDLVFATYMVPGIPPIRLRSPANGSQWQSTDIITLTAEVSPTNAAPGGVSFYNGTNLLGEVAEPPYTLLWTNPPAGAPALYATATVGSGSVTSTVVNIDVASSRPPNDVFANRFTLAGNYCQTLVTNANGTLETGESRAIPYSTGQTVWWTWTATRTAWVSLAVTNATQTNAALGVFSGATVSSLLLVTNGVGTCVFPAVTNHTYQIAVDSITGPLVGSPLILAVADVELGAPVAGAVSAAPTSFVMQTIRTATNRVLDHVDFFQGTNLLGTVSTAPYNLTAPCPNPGFFSLSVRAWDPAGIATISQSVPVTVRPQNDNFAQAMVITGYDTNIQTLNTGATVEPGEPHWGDNQGGHSIWYSWTAPADGICTITGQGVGFGLLLGVYVGPSVSQLQPVAFNALGVASDPVVFQATAGTNYDISVDGYFGGQGALDWSLSMQPLNDLFTNRTEIYGVQFEAVASLASSSLEAGEAAYVSNPNAGSVWWTWTAPSSATTTISAVSGGVPVELMVFTGSTLSSLQPVTNSGATWSTNASVTFEALDGTNYQIMVVGDPTLLADFSVSLSSQVLRLTSPSDVSTFPGPANIQFSVSQDTLTTPPARIDYYANSAVIGSATASPFDFSWTNVSAGTYILQARAISTDGLTNSSLPITILVYTNEDIPSPRVFAGPNAAQSFIVNAVGAVYVLGFPPGTVLSTTNGPVTPPVDGFRPQLANWPAARTARWQNIIDGWALTTGGQLYEEGITNIPPPAGVNWVNLGSSGWAFGDDGNAYAGGTTRLTFAATGIPWQTGGQGFEAAYTLARDGRAFRHGSDFTGHAASWQVTFPSGVTSWTNLWVASQDAVLVGNDGNIYTTPADPPTLNPFPPGVTNWGTISAGGYHIMAIGSDAQLYTWGRNFEGELGIGTAGNQQAGPQKVPLPAGVSAWTAIAAGAMYSLAIGNDGGLYAWGLNDNGQLGVGPVSGEESPTLVSGLGALWGIPIISTTGQRFRQPDGSFLIHFKTDLNRVYQIQYSDDMTTWKNATVPVLGNGGFMDWTDSGPPNTDSPPTVSPMRAYRVTFGY